MIGNGDRGNAVDAPRAGSAKQNNNVPPDGSLTTGRHFFHIPPLPNPHGRALILRHYVQSSPHLFDRSSIAKQNLSHRANVICDGSPSRIRMVLRISLGITTRPRSSMRRTIPVAFIYKIPPVKANFTSIVLARQVRNMHFQFFRRPLHARKGPPRLIPGRAFGCMEYAQFALLYVSLSSSSTTEAIVIMPTVSEVTLTIVPTKSIRM